MWPISWRRAKRGGWRPRALRRLSPRSWRTLRSNWKISANWGVWWVWADSWRIKGQTWINEQEGEDGNDARELISLWAHSINSKQRTAFTYSYSGFVWFCKSGHDSSRYLFISCVQTDEQLALLQHEKVDLLKRLEEDQEDLNELMKKHKALIAQVTLLAPQFVFSSSILKSVSLCGLVLQWYHSDQGASGWTGGGEEAETISPGRGETTRNVDEPGV